MSEQPLIDISPENWRIVRDILQRHVPDREVWAFGSRVKWTAKEFSDLDIAIIGDESLRLAVMAELNESFQDSSLPFKVDVVDWAATSGDFRKVIERDRVLVQQMKREVALHENDFSHVTDWPLAPLGELTVNFDTKRKPVKESDRKSGPYPYYGASGIVDYVDGYIFEGEHLLIAEDGENLRSRQTPIAFIANGRFWVNNHAHIVTGNKRASTRYLLYALLNADITPYLTGAVMPKLTQGNMNKIMLPCPSLAVQEQVVGILGSIDDKITLLRETNATLAAIAQALFKSWFVDFDPVRAKAEGREPEGVPPEVAELFPSEFEDSELGAIPKGWKAEPFGKLLGHAIGGDWGKDDADDEHSTAVAIVRGTDIPDIKVGNLDGVPRRFVSPRKLKSRRLQDGDLIIEVSGGSKTQATGRSLYCTEILLDDFGMPVVPASFCRLFRPADRHIGVLLAIHLSSIYAAGKMWNYQVQSTGLANFQTTHFLESELVVVPSEPIREAFFDLVRPLIERQQTADIRTTASLRDALLPRLMSGGLKPDTATSHHLSETSD